MARPRGDIRERIVRAARERFLVDGVDGASLRRIARDAHTNLGMIYYYFRTKEDLFLAVVEDVYAALLADLQAALAPDAAVEERTRRAYARLGRMSDDECTVIRLVLREAMVSSRRRARLIERFARGHLPLLLGMILDGVAAGRITDRHHPAVLVVATAVLAVLPQVVRRLVGDALPAGFDVPEGEALASALADLLLHGIARRA